MSRGKNSLREVVRSLVEFTDHGVRCRISGGSECPYTQKKYNAENFRRHFRIHHPREATENGLQDTSGLSKMSDADLSDNKPEAIAIDDMLSFSSLDESRQLAMEDQPDQSEDEKPFFKEQLNPTPRIDDTQQTVNVSKDEASGSNQKGRWYKENVRPWIQEDEDGAHCRIMEGDPEACSYTQTTLRLQNFLRHFCTMHEWEARRKGLFRKARKDGNESHAEQQKESISCAEEIEIVKTEVNDSIEEDSFSAAGHPIEQNPDIPHDDPDASKEDPVQYPVQRRGGKYEKLLNFIHQDERGAHCRIRNDRFCTYTQQILRLHNFARHFRAHHPKEAKKNGLYWRSQLSGNDEKVTGKPHEEESVTPQEVTDVVPREEEFNVVERGLAQVDDDGGVRCIIEPDGPCQYKQERYDEARFLAHFRLKHTYLGDVLFPSDAATIPDQMDNITVGEDGLFCQMEPDSGCSYFQTSYNEQTFKQHFRTKHSYLTREPEHSNKRSGLYRRLKRFMYEDDVGVHCRIACDIKCEYVQPKLQLHRFLRHFQLRHRKEATRRGLLKQQKTTLNVVKATTAAKDRPVIYQSYHLKKQGHVLVKFDGFYCSHESCDFVQEKYDEANFLKHLRQNHPTSCSNLKASNQWLTTKVAEHVFLDEQGFHCRIGGSTECTYRQRFFRMQNYYRHFYTRHREDFFRAGFMWRGSCYGTGGDDKPGASDNEPTSAAANQLEGEVELDLELSVEQESCEEGSQLCEKDSMEQERKVQQKSWIAMVKENVMADSCGIHCRVADPLCGYVQQIFRPDNFGRHFRKRHPQEARAKGFFRKNPTKPSESRQVMETYNEKEPEDETMLNPAGYCRLCSSTDQPLEPIFQEQHEHNPLIPMIDHFTGITLTIDSDNQACICEKCRHKLEDIQRFREHCQDFDRKVRRRETEDSAAARPCVPFVGVESGATQNILSVDAIKKEEPADAMDDDPLVEEVTADVEDELPYIGVLNNLFKCRYCERVCQSLDSMMDHYQEMHQEAN